LLIALLLSFVAGAQEVTTRATTEEDRLWGLFNVLQSNAGASLLASTGLSTDVQEALYDYATRALADLQAAAREVSAAVCRDGPALKASNEALASRVAADTAAYRATRKGIADGLKGAMTESDYETLSKWIDENMSFTEVHDVDISKEAIAGRINAEDFVTKACAREPQEKHP
jgi:hypothetical protein